jgi:hypothetical protein
MTERNSVVLAFAAGASLAVLAYKLLSGRNTLKQPNDGSDVYSLADQPARFAYAKSSNNRRVLSIDEIYSAEYVKGKTVLVTGTILNSSYVCDLKAFVG